MIWQNHYETAQTCMKKHEARTRGFSRLLAAITKATTNLDSVIAEKTRELDKKDISKTALKELVSGDPSVLEHKAILGGLKNKKEVLNAQMKHLEMMYNLEKKAMDAITKEMQYIGGQRG
jgi:DNA-binding transcriptional regulator GbsR (MarR family)